MQERYDDPKVIKKLRNAFMKLIKYIGKQSTFTIGIYIILLLTFLFLIAFIHSINLFKSESIVTITTEKFLDAVREGDEELIITYSNAEDSDFNDEIDDLLEIGNTSIHEIIDSWFGLNGTRILDDIIGIGNKVGSNVFYKIMEYKIVNYKIKKEKAIVKVRMTKLKSFINIELIKIDDIWIIDYRQYKRDFDNIVLGSTATKILDLVNLRGLF
jgi:hypothetical protein